MKDEFYIGWMPKAPKTFIRYMRRVVIILLFLGIMTGIILSLQQKQFSTAVFEFGKLTEIKGVYQEFPVPSIRVSGGNSTYLTIPLVGYGKSGAEGLISQLEKERQTSLDKKQVTLRGTLLYSDGKTLLQIDGNDQPLLSIENANDTSQAFSIAELGIQELNGEILDPKCYFGVMKPGYGKPHRDCAVRCIEGGISPVFHTGNDYYLILDENGNKINDRLKDYVAEPVSLKARVVRYNDWIVLYTFSNSIRRIGGLSWKKQKEQTISCGR